MLATMKEPFATIGIGLMRLRFAANDGAVGQGL